MCRMARSSASCCSLGQTVCREIPSSPGGFVATSNSACMSLGGDRLGGGYFTVPLLSSTVVCKLDGALRQSNLRAYAWASRR